MNKSLELNISILCFIVDFYTITARQPHTVLSTSAFKQNPITLWWMRYVTVCWFVASFWGLSCATKCDEEKCLKCVTPFMDVAIVPARYVAVANRSDSAFFHCDRRMCHIPRLNGLIDYYVADV